MFQFSDYGLSVDVVLLGAIAAILILLILCLILIGKNSSLRKRYDEFMRDSDGKSLEEAFQKKFTIWIISMAKSKKSMSIWL